MNKLINVNGKNEICYSARDLYEELEIKTDFNDWFSDICTYGFKLNEDYYLYQNKNNDYLLTEYMAKEIMIFESKEGNKEIRKKLIQLEDDWNDYDKVMERALSLAKNELLSLSEKYEVN